LESVDDKEDDLAREKSNEEEKNINEDKVIENI
jgi:hypothetical protein